MNKEFDLLPYSIKSGIPFREIIEIDSYLLEYCTENNDALMCNRSYEIIPKTKKDRKKSKSLLKDKKLIGQGTYGRIYSVSSFQTDVIIKASVPNVNEEFIALHEIFVNVVIINQFLRAHPFYKPNFVPTYGFFACAQLDNKYSRSRLLKVIRKDGTDYTVKPKNIKSVIPKKGSKIFLKDTIIKVTESDKQTKEFKFKSRISLEIDECAKYTRIIPTKILDFCTEQGNLNFNLIQKNMKGYKDLYDFLPLLSLSQFKTIMKKLMKVLHALNKYCDFQHNDLHPGNIMVKQTGDDFDVVLIDFAFASFKYKGFFYYNIIDLSSERTFELKIERSFKSCMYDLLFLFERTIGYNKQIDGFLKIVRLQLFQPLLPLNPPNYKIYDYLLTVDLEKKSIDYVGSITYKWFLEKLN